MRLALQISLVVTALATIAASIGIYAAVWAPKPRVTHDELSAAVYHLEFAIHDLQAAQDRAVRPSDLATLMSLINNRLSCLEKVVGNTRTTKGRTPVGVATPQSAHPCQHTAASAKQPRHHTARSSG